MKLQGILFDLDGVLTDTAYYHYLAWKRLTDELGLRFTEKENEHLKGIDRLSSLERILSQNSVAGNYTDQEKRQLAERKNNYYKEFLKDLSKKDILPGIPDFLEVAKQAGCRLAVASVSKNAQFVLQRLGMSDCFDFVADASIITKPKPEPDIFLACSKALDLTPACCVGIDDSSAGIEAIRRAGMFAVGIHAQAGRLLPHVDLPSTKELNFDEIARAWETSLKNLLAARGTLNI